jgi:hypothetical protein
MPNRFSISATLSTTFSNPSSPVVGLDYYFAYRAPGYFIEESELASLTSVSGTVLDSTSHDVNRKDATLMTRKEVINEITDDGVGLVAELCHHPAGQHPCAAVPFQVDRPVRGFAVDFSPSMRATRTLMFSGNQIKTPKLRIVHDFVAQRSAPSRNYLNYGLHLI